MHLLSRVAYRGNRVARGSSMGPPDWIKPAGENNRSEQPAVVASKARAHRIGGSFGHLDLARDC